MVTDLAGIVLNLTEFYDFAEKTVIAVGAGGGQLSEYARNARRVVAVDRDAAACKQLATVTRERGLEAKFTILESDFLTIRPAGDVVLFEFCLHQIRDPGRALIHAAQLTREIVVLDHAPGSRWEWYAGEEGNVEAAWSSVARTGFRRAKEFEAVQRFEDFAALEARLASQGSVSASRIAELRGRQPIEIAMPYRLALIETLGT